MATSRSKLHDKGRFFLGLLHQFPEQQYVYFLQLSLVSSLWTDPTSIPARPCTIVFIGFHSCSAGGHGIKPTCQIILSSKWLDRSSCLSLWFGSERISVSELFQIQSLQTMSYDSNSSLDRALELAKKRYWVTEQGQAKVNFILRAMQFNYESEDGGGSTAKRHLGSGPEIHLKLLIPRFTNTFNHLIFKLNMVSKFQQCCWACDRKGRRHNC